MERQTNQNGLRRNQNQTLKRVRVTQRAKRSQSLNRHLSTILSSTYSRALPRSILKAKPRPLEDRRVGYYNRLKFSKMSLHRRNLLLLQRLLRNKLLQSRKYLQHLLRSNHQRSSCKPVCFRSFQLSQQSPTQWRPLRPTPRQSPKSQRRRVLRNQKFQRQR